MEVNMPVTPAMYGAGNGLFNNGNDWLGFIFPDVDTTTNLQVSVVDCNTNTLVYKEDCTPFLANEVVANIRYSIVFSPFVGGYVITSPSCPVQSQPAKDEKSEEVGDTK